MLEDIKPTQQQLVIDLLARTGADVSDWANYNGKHPSTNPKYCYNWSFEQPGEFIVVCLWFNDLEEHEGSISYKLNGKSFISRKEAPGSPVWKRRSAQFYRNIEKAFREQLPIRAIILAGKQRKHDDEEPMASSVKARHLDSVHWAALDYDLTTGEGTLVRGAVPLSSATETADVELSYFEGRTRKAFVKHRQREARLRRDKIADFKKTNGGKLFCEVPNCGFDYSKIYGPLGEDYAQVHHLMPLNQSPDKGRPTKLSELAIVCASCHAMIHRNGKCRPLSGLIAKLV